MLISIFVSPKIILSALRNVLVSQFYSIASALRNVLVSQFYSIASGDYPLCKTSSFRSSILSHPAIIRFAKRPRFAVLPYRLWRLTSQIFKPENHPLWE
jgi:hypothetical protein